MSRLVELKPAEAVPSRFEFAGAEAGWQERVKEYGERIAKYVPAEVLAFYTAAVELILTKGGIDHRGFRLWAFAVVGLVAWIGTPLYLGMFTKNRRQRRVNQIVASIAFGVWAYSYPAGWFAEQGWHDPVVGGLLLLFFSFASGFYQPRAIR
ncbi:MAG: hypothetical protein NT151_05650 [Acidobacteria bacterium]|jgi:hypothetical protein|nr:hypothetical protein [Acidobacteriota bacterium]